MYPRMVYFSDVQLFRSRTPRYIFSSTLYRQSYWCIIQITRSSDLKLSPGSECKIVLLGLLAGVKLILLDDVSEFMLIPSSGSFSL
jgi:hypothetical protein